VSQVAKDEEQGHRGYLFAGFASLFAAAFMDNARGPVLPVLCKQLDIPYETAGLFLMLGNASAVLATFLLGRLLPLIGDRKAAILVSWLAVLPGLLAPFVHDKTSLLSLGILLGASVSLVGSLSSILTVRGSPLQSRGRFMSIQQVMYGIGSLIAPLLFSALTHAERPWWWLFTGSSVVCLLLGFAYIKSLPIEKIEAPVKTEIKSASSLNLASWGVILLCAMYVAGEVLASMWMTSLLVGSQGFLPADAAQYQMGFFLLMGITRFLCFLFVKARWESAVLVSCLIGGAFFAILGQQGYSWALPLMGILGPFFPLSMSRISLQFPGTWKQMMIHVYVGIQMILGMMHLSVGWVADTFGIAKAFLLSPVFLLLALLLLVPSLRKKPSE
jgi:MFS family permease